MPSKITMLKALFDECIEEAAELNGIDSPRYKLLIDRMSWLQEWTIEELGGQDNVVTFGR